MRDGRRAGAAVRRPDGRDAGAPEREKRAVEVCLVVGVRVGIDRS
jgi:hypothetical protein